MKKIIVTTTINYPTKATLKFCEIAEKKDFTFLIVGDTKTPHEEYINLKSKYKNLVYLSPEKQDELYPKISQIIGWKTIQRRNIGFLYSYLNYYDIIATIDDDNIPYDNWGDNILIGKEVEVDIYKNTSCNYFDPISVTNHENLWHRGYPIEYLNVKNNIEYQGKKKIAPLVQAEFWDGDPDIDAICRLSKKPIVRFDKFNDFTTEQYAPFNSQNTFLHRSVLPRYSVLPFIGRMDDIWGSYILQYYFPSSVVYREASVYQERNPQDLIKNLENEIFGYKNNLSFLNDLKNYKNYLPKPTINYINVYEEYFN